MWAEQFLMLVQTAGTGVSGNARTSDAEVDPSKVEYQNTYRAKVLYGRTSRYRSCRKLIKEAQRPLIIAGGGATQAQKEIREFVDKSEFPLYPQLLEELS